MVKLITYIILSVVFAIALSMVFVGGVSSPADNSHTTQRVYEQPAPEVEEVKTIVSYEFPPGYNNPDITDMQKTAYFDNELKGEYVQWTGVISDVTMSGRTVKISVDHGASMTSNALIRLADGQFDKAIALQRGDEVTYTAKMTRWGSFLGFYGEDGEIV